MNTPNSALDGINVVSVPFPVAGQTLVARLEMTATQGTLFINGTPLLSVPRGTYVGPSRVFYFGDGTNQEGAEFYVSSFRASGMAPSCTPTSVVNVGAGCSTLGTLSFSGIVQPGQPVAPTFTVPGATLGGIALILAGPYAMQPPYCPAGCRFGLDLTGAILFPTETLALSFPAMSALVGWPIAFQGVRVGINGSCPNPVPHALTDISVMTL